MTATIIIALVAFALIAWILPFFAKENLPDSLNGHWSHYVPDLQFSSKEFYDAVENLMAKREIPDTAYTREEFSERGGMFGKKRLYLRVRNGMNTFDICAAPYGTGFFLSWWFGEDQVGCLTRLLLNVPFANIYVKARLEKKTYYIVDTEDMFRKATHLAVVQSLDAILSQKGLRALSELERQIIKR